MTDNLPPEAGETIPPKRAAVLAAQDQLGKEPDGAIADRLGVSLSLVRNIRAELGIAASKTRRKQRKTRKGKTRRMRKSKLDPVRHKMGTMPDKQLADEMGMTIASVANYRRKYNIPSFRTAQRQQREAANAQAANQSVANVAALPAPTSPAQVSPAPAPVAPSPAAITRTGGHPHAFRAHLMGSAESMIIVATDMVAAAAAAGRLGHVSKLEALGRVAAIA